MEKKKDIFDYIEKQPTEMPDTLYFSNLSSAVLDKMNHQKQVKVVPLYKRSVGWISAVAAVIFVAFLLLPEKTNPVVEDFTFTTLSKNEVLAYVDDNIVDFDVELLTEFIPKKDLATKNNTKEELIVPSEETIVERKNPDLEKSLKSISTDDIQQYLEDEGIDLDNLEDELFL